MDIQLRKSAQKDLKKMEKKLQERVLTKIEELKKFPDVSHVKKLTNFDPAFRRRIGDFRILFDVEKNTIFIGRILHRKESYT